MAFNPGCLQNDPASQGEQESIVAVPIFGLKVPCRKENCNLNNVNSVTRRTVESLARSHMMMNDLTLCGKIRTNNQKIDLSDDVKKCNLRNNGIG